MIRDAKHLTQKILDLCEDAKQSDIGFVDIIGALTTARLLHEHSFLKAQDNRKIKQNYKIRNKKKAII